MLTELRIRNFAIIESLTLPLAREGYGMECLTVWTSRCGTADCG